MGTSRRLDDDHIGAEISEDLAAEQRPFIGEVEYPVMREHLVSLLQNVLRKLTREARRPTATVEFDANSTRDSV